MVQPGDEEFSQDEYEGVEGAKEDYAYPRAPKQEGPAKRKRGDDEGGDEGDEGEGPAAQRAKRRSGGRTKAPRDGAKLSTQARGRGCLGFRGPPRSVPSQQGVVVAAGGAPGALCDEARGGAGGGGRGGEGAAVRGVWGGGGGVHGGGGLRGANGGAGEGGADGGASGGI